MPNKGTLLLLFRIPLIIFSVTIIVLSHQQQIEIPDIGFEWIDKIIHFIAFLIYGLSLNIFILSTYSIASKKQLTLIIVIGALFAASDEIHQYYVPGRIADVYDWIADCLGIISSLFFFNLLKYHIFAGLFNVNNKYQ